MLRRLYDWVIENAHKPQALWILVGISFAESSFLPLVPDVVLIPMILAERRRAFWLATWATVSSVIGGYLGYAIGYLAFESIGVWLIEHLWTMEGFQHAKAQFNDWGFWLIVGKGLTPIPYKIVTILCGVLHYDLAKFTLASIIARGMRFYAEAVALYIWGDAVRGFLERWLVWVTTSIVVAIVGAVLAFRYL
ncbi:MAG TPA: YqaA family protein [Stellaceae bacterium]|nr:YqaA family protein [Stellaceae bacterium]